MDKLYDKSFDLTALMIKELSSAVTTQDFSGVTQIERELKVYTDKILETKELMIEQIRTELDEI